MSSAILYIAIVAIWAGVLIPRWLRRDSSSGQRDSSAGQWDGEDLSTAEAPTAKPDPAAGEEPGPRRWRREEPAPVAAVAPAAPAETRSVGLAEGRASSRAESRAEGRSAASKGRRERAEDRREAAARSPRDRERKRVLSARRRMLLMLLGLAIGSGALAVTKMAAWWVIVPPCVMLLGYLTVLKAAAKADAEQRAVARSHAARAASMATIASGATARPAAPPLTRTAASPVSRPVVPAAPVVATAPPRPGPDAEVIDISASRGHAGEQLYDQYKDAKRRAVGD